MKSLAAGLLIALACLCLAPAQAQAKDAGQIIQDYLNYVRGNASISTVTMTIVRPDWQRQMTIKAWTKGQSNSLFQIMDPPRDAGNGTLKKGRQMWMYNPKINRIIKLPPSMMSQAWMGSDFSNNDLSKSDTITKDYDHKITATDQADGHKVYSIECIPKPMAPVVWGKLTFKIRDDNIPIEQNFFDEDMKLVKALSFTDVKKMGGRLLPAVWTMKKADSDGEYTKVVNKEVEFKNDLPDRYFTLENLKNPRR